MRSRFCWCTFNAWHEKKHAQLVDKKMPQSKTCGENMQHKKTPCNMRGNQCDLLSETSRTAECWKCWKRDDDVLPSNMLAHFWLSSTCWCQRHPQIFGRRMGKRWKQGRKGAHSAISQRWSQEIFFFAFCNLTTLSEFLRSGYQDRNSYDPGIGARRLELQPLHVMKRTNEFSRWTISKTRRKAVVKNSVKKKWRKYPGVIGQDCTSIKPFVVRRVFSNFDNLFFWVPSWIFYTRKMEWKQTQKVSKN